MKRILYFYPHKFSNLTDGIHTRIVTILEYFKSRGFSVDMIHFENPTVNSSYLLENNLVENLYLVADSPFVENPESLSQKLKRQIGQKKNSVSFRLFPEQFKSKSGKKVKILPDLMTKSLTNKVSELTGKNNYCAVLVTYSYWADLVHSINQKSLLNTLKVIDPTDFLTLQQFYTNRDLSFNQVGNMFGDEMKKVNLFDDVMHISYDELLLFSNFLPERKHHYIPQFFKNSFLPKRETTKYDMLLIASKNPYNVEGVNWFLESVYPLISQNVRIGIAGNICSKITFKGENIELLGFVDNLASLYEDSLFTICPLKRGSGMKIKVIESLSHGLPVVSTAKGVDGFINKDLDGGVMITDDPIKFAWYIGELIRNPKYYDEQREMARKLFERNFSVEPNFTKLDKIFISE